MSNNYFIYHLFFRISIFFVTWVVFKSFRIRIIVTKCSGGFELRNGNNIETAFISLFLYEVLNN